LLDPFCDAAHLVENFVRVLNAQVRLDDAAHGAEHLADCPVHVVDWNALFADQLVLKLDLLALGPEFRQHRQRGDLRRWQPRRPALQQIIPNANDAFPRNVTLGADGSTLFVPNADAQQLEVITTSVK
jgi:hypothetical protein